ncbi:MAG TPA: LacI family DNA-binding transcriptional regulator [Bryobacteraceae bacterium]|jgi:LacI family transcriptional regulator|nr:LacI family DNA-binding transcriptional regulator [Bryobacteraceae bacterium]
MNLEDVAQRAGVSTATVSRVLNNIGVVKGSTRAKVLKAVEELKYYPNIHARALAGGASKALGLIVSNVENPFFLDIFRSLEDEAHSRGFEVLMANTDYDPDRLAKSVHLMLGRRVAGLALIVSEMDSTLLQELQDRKVRTLILDVGQPRPYITSIKTNYSRGMQRIAEYLYSLGHRKMAFIGHHTSLGPLSDRKRTFSQVMEQLGGGVVYTTIADSDGFDGGRRAVRQLYHSGFNPTAILCVNDFMAVGVLRQLREMNISVPQDVSVTGFDNIRLSEFLNPALTTVHIPREQIGRQIFESLTSSTSPEESPREVIIDPELVVRESTGSVRAL